MPSSQFHRLSSFAFVYDRMWLYFSAKQPGNRSASDGPARQKNKPDGIVHSSERATATLATMNEPEIAKAAQARTNLEQQKQDAQRIVKEMQDTAAAITLPRLALQNRPSEEIIRCLLDTTRLLRKKAKAILAKAPQFLEKIDGLTNTLQSTPDTYLAAAKLFRSQADKELYAKMADNYRQIATMFEKFAERDRNDKTKLGKNYNREAIVQLLQYIKHQERFLEHLQAVLEVMQIGDTEMDAFLKEIAAYTKAFEDFEQEIRGTQCSAGDARTGAAISARTRTSPPREANRRRSSSLAVTTSH